MIKIKQTGKNMGLITYPLIDMFMYEVNKPQRVCYFGNALFDKYSLVMSNDISTEEELTEYLHEASSGYEDVFLFIIPKSGIDSNPVWNHIQNILTDFKNGKDPELFSENPILIATREFDDKFKKAKEDVDYYKKALEESLAREVSLLNDVFELKKNISKN